MLTVGISTSCPSMSSKLLLLSLIYESMDFNISEDDDINLSSIDVWNEPERFCAVFLVNGTERFHQKLLIPPDSKCKKRRIENHKDKTIPRRKHQEHPCDA